MDWNVQSRAGWGLQSPWTKLDEFRLLSSLEEG